MVEGDVWSIRDTPLLVRCEHDSGGYACRVLLVDSDNVGDATSLPWWRSALSHERVLELYRSREAARAVEKAGDHARAAVAYDDILDVLDVALRDPALGPCCATQALLAKCLFSRAWCRLALGGRDDLRRACEDCHRATESKHTGWLRAGLEEDADILGDGLGRLHGRILEALRDLALTGGDELQELRELCRETLGSLTVNLTPTSRSLYVQRSPCCPSASSAHGGVGAAGLLRARDLVASVSFRHAISRTTFYAAFST